MHTHSEYATSSHAHGMGDLSGFAGAAAADGKLLVGHTDGTWHGDTHLIGTAATAKTLWSGLTIQTALDLKAESTSLDKLVCAGKKQATFGVDILAANPKLTVIIGHPAFKGLSDTQVVAHSGAYVITGGAPPYAPLATGVRAWVDAGQLKQDIWFDATQCSTFDTKVAVVSYSLSKANDT